MTRIRFEDLPSTNTPRNAENLNKLNNVVIGTTEPTTGEEMWVQKGKNLFDKNKVILNYELQGTVGTITAHEGWFVSDFIAIDGDTDYYISGERTSGTSNAFYDENYNYIDFAQALEGTYKTPSNAKYVRFNGLISELDTNIQLEQGSTATTYEEYIDKKIYTKNDNGVYEEFYSKEHDTGWVDMSSYINTTYFAPRAYMPPMVRKIGNKVYWKGFVYCKTNVEAKDANILENLPYWCNTNYEYGTGGVIYEYGINYYIFKENNNIRINMADNISSLDQYHGFSLSSISGYLTD